MVHSLTSVKDIVVAWREGYPSTIGFQNNMFSPVAPQACRTPSRNETGVELLAKYFSHLPLIESRFFSPTHQTGIFFTW